MFVTCVGDYFYQVEKLLSHGLFIVGEIMGVINYLFSLVVNIDYDMLNPE
jgi:hypothetical protein